MTPFTDTTVCKSRRLCYLCRHREDVRLQWEAHHGPWECPEGYELGTPLELLPEKTRHEEARKVVIEQAREGRVEKLRGIIQTLWSALQPQDRVHLFQLWKMVLPGDLSEMGVHLNRSHRTCAHAGPKLDEIDQECCGGAVRKVARYACNAGNTATALTCRSCLDHTPKEEYLKDRDGVALFAPKTVGHLFLSFGCEECEPVRLFLQRLGWYGHSWAYGSDAERIRVVYGLTEEEVLRKMEKQEVGDRSIPCLRLRDEVIVDSEHVIAALRTFGLEKEDPDGLSRVFMA